MAYVRKTRDRWDIMTDYGYGWEVEASYYSWPECYRDYQEYLEHVHHYGGRARIKKHREPITN